MTICPVCEHPQQFGLECEVCGRDLSALSGLSGMAPPPVAIERVEGLEQTIPERVGDVGIDRFAELEANRFAKVQVAPDATPDVEPSRMAPVGEVQVERVTELAVDRAPDDGVRTAAPSGQVTCRYCKNVQAMGTVCDRCGMKLPRALEIESAAKKADWVRCRACGAPGPIGERCKECGRPVEAAEP